MIPKEKAQELVDKMTVVGLQMRSEGIQCAIIAVDEMINMITSNDVDVWDIDILKYWQEVKQEIEKL